MSQFSRRSLLRSTAAGAAGFLGLQSAFQTRLHAQGSVGFGALVSDPLGVLDLPPGFKYRAISLTGDLMDDGYRVPGLHDGMAAYPGPNGSTILVRNHEMGVAAAGTAGSPFPDIQSYLQTDRNLVYDPGTTAPAAGGTTNLIYNTRLLKLERHFLSSTGMIRNCAGGSTNWNSWLTCEETNLTSGTQSGGSTLSADHGWVFDVRATDQFGIQRPMPLKAMGRFSHEAVAMHPGLGIVYQTEDRGDSAFYRFIPDTPGNLLSGKLQAMRFKNSGIQNTSNANSIQVPVGTSFQVEWVDLTGVESPADDLRIQAQSKGGAIFARGEGAWWGNGVCYFASTSGGPTGLGQIFQYTPSPVEGTAAEVNQPATLRLFIEPSAESQFAAPDNICIAPSGDVIVCEDGSGVEYVHGVTPNGAVYKIARNALNTSEFAGACFSPDGSTLFVNMQTPGITFAITGPWHRRALG